jgi:hypothetical protein
MCQAILITMTRHVALKSVHNLQEPPAKSLMVWMTPSPIISTLMLNGADIFPQTYASPDTTKATRNYDDASRTRKPTNDMRRGQE